MRLKSRNHWPGLRTATHQERYISSKSVPNNEIPIDRLSVMTSPLIDLQLNYPILDSQAVEWNKRLGKIADRGGAWSMQLSPYAGSDEIRAAGAELLDVPLEHVSICAGGHHACFVAILAARLAGKMIAVESLTYSGFKVQCEQFGIRLVACETDEHGIVPAALRSLCDRGHLSALYTMPTVHNPLGTVTPLERRLEIVSMARAANLTIIEDDAYGFLEPSAPANYALLAPERSFYIWSFSKPFCPSLKTAFLVSPPQLHESVVKSIRITSSGASSLNSHIACELIEDGSLQRCIEAKREEGARRQLIARAILGGGKIQSHPMSWHVWLPLDFPQRADDIESKLLGQGVRIVAARSFAPVDAPYPQAIRISLGGEMNIERLICGLTTVHRVVHS
jgi:DNA-binding transcriptional MocR family regulator